MSIVIAELKESVFDFVHDSQKTFKSLLMASAFPGKIHQINIIHLAFPDESYHAILQPFLTLLDLETGFCVYSHDIRRKEKVSSYITINTNCPYVPISEADFILCLEPTLGESFKELKNGTLHRPDKSATVFYLAESVCNESDNGSVQLVLTGPGVKNETRLSFNGIEIKEIEKWKTNRKNYPLGVDVFIITKSGDLVSIPRSVKISYEK